jgi:hypothetical protein
VSNPTPPPATGWAPPPANITIAQNTDHTLIVVSEDKARLCLGKHVAMAGKRNEWLAPASLLVSLIATLTAAEFRDALLMSKALWKAVFLVTSLVCLGWLVRSLFRRGKVPDDDGLVESIVSKLKSGR